MQFSPNLREKNYFSYLSLWFSCSSTLFRPYLIGFFITLTFDTCVAKRFMLSRRKTIFFVTFFFFFWTIYACFCLNFFTAFDSFLRLNLFELISFFYFFLTFFWFYTQLSHILGFNKLIFDLLLQIKETVLDLFNHFFLGTNNSFINCFKAISINTATFWLNQVRIKCLSSVEIFFIHREKIEVRRGKGLESFGWKKYDWFKLSVFLDYILVICDSRVRPQQNLLFIECT